jgi:hypothetical protein
MFESLLLKLGTGELTAAERRWLTGYADQNPAARFDLALLDSLPDALRESALPIHSRVGIDAVMRRVEANEKSHASFLSKLTAWIGGTVPAKAFAGACALVVVQLGVLGALVQHSSASERESEQYRAVRSDGATHAVVRVNFKDKTTEQDMRFLLVSNGARIVAGPTQLGSYYLTVRKGREADLARTLEASALVASVQADVQLPDE